jgi:hypothetical protein
MRIPVLFKSVWPMAVREVWQSVGTQSNNCLILPFRTAMTLTTSMAELHLIYPSPIPARPPGTTMSRSMAFSQTLLTIICHNAVIKQTRSQRRGVPARVIPSSSP